MSICVDPGHTSETSAGTQSRDGKLTERHLNWVSRRPPQESSPGVGRRDGRHDQDFSENEFVTNMRRAQIANNAHAATFPASPLRLRRGPGLRHLLPRASGNGARRHRPVSRHAESQRRRRENVFHKATIAALAGALPDHGLRTEAGTKIGGKQGALTGSIFAKVPGANRRDGSFEQRSKTTRSRERRRVKKKLPKALLAGVDADAHFREINFKRFWFNLRERRVVYIH